jgi:translocation and assembly module TamA
MVNARISKIMLSTTPKRAALCLCAALLLVACGTKRPGQQWVHEIKLSGNATVDEDDILDGLWTRETSWWDWTPFADTQWYEPSLLDQDLRRIEAFYARQGYFRAQVLGRKVTERPGKRSVDIKVKVKEGKPTNVSEVTITGLAKLPEPLRTKAAAELGLEQGKRFDHGAYITAKAKILARLKAAGYAYAKVEGKVEVDRDKRSAAIAIKADPGPTIRFGKLKLKADPIFPEDKLLRLVAWEEGQSYDPALIDKTKAAFHGHKVFSTVRIDLPEEPTAIAPVTIETTPAKLRELRLGLGLGIENKRHEVRLRGTWTLRNVLGGLRTLRLQLQPAFVALPAAWDAERIGPAIEADIKLSQPDWFNTGLDAWVMTGYDLGIHEGYQFHGPRLGLGIERELGFEALRGGLSWNLRFLDFFGISDAFDPAKTDLGVGFVDPFRLAYLGQFLRLDLRDDRKDPRAGLLAEIHAEQGFPQIGGEFSYLKVSPELRGYIPLGTKRLVLALRAKYAHIEVLGGAQGESPVTQRVYFGGPTNHRGFTYGRLSPQSKAERVPLGGNDGLLLSADLRLRIYKVADAYWLGLTGFFDAGDVWRTDLPDFETPNLHLAAGFSLNFQTPVGALRTGLGFRLNRTDEALSTPDPGEWWAFHLTIGEAF